MGFKRLVSSVAAVSLGIASVVAVTVLEIAPAGAIEGTVPSNVAASWQTNGAVYAIAAADGVVYIGGDFTSVRPPGSPAGSGEVARNHLAAFNANTGALLTAINPNVNGSVRVLAASNDGHSIYAGGDFTAVGATTRNRIASFTATSGALGAWNPNANGRVAGIAATSTTVFVGGSFSTIGGRTERRVAALNPSSGAALATFTSTPDNVVYQIAVSPQGDRLYLAGAFLSVNGDTNYHAAASISTATGNTLPFAAGSVIPPKTDACIVEAKSVKTDSTGAYFGVEGTGGGCFDGTFAANNDGSLRWQSLCLGATQAVEVLNGVLYTGSHSHDCSGDFGRDPDAFPEIGWSKGLSRHLLSRTTAGGLLDNWYPNTNGGPNGAGLGPRVIATDGNQLFVGGEFTTVNGLQQQGFARFSPATGDLAAPARPATPTAVATAGGKVSIYVQAPLDTDDTDLTIRLYRDGGAVPIAAVPVHSLFWKQPAVAFTDNSLALGSTHTYTADAIETNGPNAGPKSSASRAVTVVSAAPAYEAAVAADNPSLYWRLGDAAGPLAADSSAGLNGGSQFGTVAYGVAGAVPGNTAITTNGVDGQLASSQQQVGPSTFTVETWFKTTSTSGGKLIGFGDRQGGLDFSGNPAVSGSYDKQIYMTNDGHLVFGVYVNGTNTITSSNAYNDGQWHQVVGTQGPLGMNLYLDGAKVGHNPQTQNQAYSGYWRLGGDNLNGWPNQPSSFFFAGSLDEAAVYDHPLTLGDVQDQYAASGRTPPPSTVPADAYGKAVYNDGATSFWRLDETSGTVAADSTDNSTDGTYVGGVTQGAAGALGAVGNAATFDGSTANVVSQNAINGPSTYATELWFKTGTNNGGKLIGFGNAQSGTSGNYDKQVYMLNDGRLVFGVYNGGFDTVYSSAAYNDNQWHHLVAQQGAGGMAMYLDDHLVGTNPQTNNQVYGGYWRVGGDNLGAWPDRPNTDYFAGTIDEVAIYALPLTPAQVDAHYLASGRSGPDVIDPTTAITAPTEGSTVNSGTVSVSATANDNVGVTSVDLQVDGTTVATDTSAPYTFSWTATDGAHTLRTVAHDAAGNSGNSADVHVTAATADTTNPTTSITSPSAGANVFGPVTVTADAADNSGVASVSLLVDGSTFGTDTTAPYTFNWTATDEGPHTLQTVAVDTSGNTGQSAQIGVVVPTDTTDPTVTITAPNAGDSVYGTVNVAATASDDRGVTSVDLLVDGAIAATDTTAPYTFSWSATAVGNHTLQAVAHDAAGNAGNSAAVAVTVPADTTAPSIPGSLSASGITTNSVTLSWTASNDDRSLAGYQVVRDGTALPGTVAGLTFTDSGLTAGQTYSYVVRAVDATGNVSGDSNTQTVTTTVTNPVLFSETWPGADGVAWPAAWTAGNANGTVDTQGGAGRLANADVANAYARAQLTGLANRANSDLVTSFTWSANTAVSYLSVFARGSGGWQNAYRPKNGYGVELQSNSGTVVVQKSVNGTMTNLASVTAAQQVTTGKQWLRLRISGSTIQFKIWADGTSEPTTWKSTITDTSITAAGQTFLSLNRGATNVGTKAVTFDDLSIQDAP
jgi:hypothetical protein